MRVKVGRVTKPFGRRGEVKVMTSYPPDFFLNKRVYILGRGYEVEGARSHSRFVLLKFRGVDDIEEAELLRNLYVEVEEEDLEPTSEDEYYVYQLLGCDVYSKEGDYIGKVVDMHEWGPYWTMEVEGEVYVPFIKVFVEEVDVSQKRIKVDISKLRPSSGV